MWGSVGQESWAWIGVVGGILGVAGLIGAAIAVLRSSIATNTITLLKENNAALKDQNENQAEQLHMLQSTVGRQQVEIQTLTERVDAKAAIEAMNGKLDRMLARLEAK